MFFSVKTPVRIAGKVYMPCICYSLARNLEATIKSLEEKGKAVIHADTVFFQNGKIIEGKEVVKENLTAETKAKKEKKHKKEEVVSNNDPYTLDTADTLENGGF